MTIPKKKILVTLCSKNPNHYLLKNIDFLINKQLIEEDYTICVIDSDSQILNIYLKIKKKFPNVNIHHIKNKNYEYGAYKYSYLMYPDFDIYICIQDTLEIIKKIDLNVIDDKTAYICKNKSGFSCDKSNIELGMKILKTTSFKYPDFLNNKSKRYFNMAQHCSFIVSRHLMSDIFKVFTIPPTDKCGSQCYERLFGLYFIYKNIKTIDLKEKKKCYIKKHHSKRR